MALQCCVSVVHQCEAAVHIPLSRASLSPPTRLGYHSTELSVLHMVVYMCRCYSLNSSHPLLPPLCPHAHSLHLCLFSCPANRFISTVFLEGNWLLPLGYLFPIHLAFLSRISCIPVFFCVQLVFFFFFWFSPQVGKIPWRREWQPTPVFLSGDSHGQRCLAGYSPHIALQRVGHNWVTNTATATVNNIQILCSFTVLSHLTLVVDVTGLHLYNCLP